MAFAFFTALSVCDLPDSSGFSYLFDPETLDRRKIESLNCSLRDFSVS